MASLNQIADTIADGVGKSLDFTFKQRVKFAVKYWRARLIRQEVQKYGANPAFLQQYHVTLSRVDLTHLSPVTSECYVMESTHCIPKSVRLENNLGLLYVGSITGKRPFSYCPLELLEYKLAVPFTRNLVYYELIETTEGTKLRVFNNTKIKYVLIRDFLEDPAEVNTCNCNEDGEIIECYNDDMNFPIPFDLIPIIIQGLIKGELAINPNDLEVDIKPETTDRD
jgi:hypothetical protein